VIITPTLITGFPLIDQQHEQIFNIVDTLETMASSNGNFREVAAGTRRHLTPATGTISPVLVRKVIERLIYYAVLHFEYEESLLAYASPALSKIPDDEYEMFTAHANLHRREHHSFSATINEYREQAAAYCTISPANIYTFVFHWVSEHVGKTDQDMCKWLRRADGVAG
jgi:hemerythrin-like metal-binding protein